MEAIFYAKLCIRCSFCSMDHPVDGSIWHEERFQCVFVTVVEQGVSDATEDCEDNNEEHHS
jgi:hypothetical protein